MQFVRCLTLLLVFTCTALEGFRPSPCPEVLTYAETHFPSCGILKNFEGFVYVDIDDDYIHKLLPLVDEEGFEEPPYFGREGLVGAHISVIYPSESEKYGLGEIEECGQPIFFHLKKCEIVHPSKWKEMDEVYLIVVEAPELDWIREKYGLPKQLYEFHITLGVKKGEK